MNDTLKLVLVAVSSFVLVFTVSLYGLNQLDKKECAIHATSFEEHSHTFIGGCMVKHQGRWLPLKNIRGFDGKS